jgi:hypothetical protein
MLIIKDSLLEMIFILIGLCLIIKNDFLAKLSILQLKKSLGINMADDFYLLFGRIGYIIVGTVFSVTGIVAIYYWIIRL